MALSLFRKAHATEPVFAVYADIVAQSRQPRFYAEWGVPDTVTGRFDMITLHLALLFRRLRREGKPARDFSQALFDLFFKDMDRSLREMGAGDLAVPKKIRKMGNIFYGLLASLDTALASNDVLAVETVLQRNIFAEIDGIDARPLAEYVLAHAAELAAQPAAALMVGSAKAGQAA